MIEDGLAAHEAFTPRHGHTGVTPLGLTGMDLAVGNGVDGMHFMMNLGAMLVETMFPGLNSPAVRVTVPAQLLCRATTDHCNAVQAETVSRNLVRLTPPSEMTWRPRALRDAVHWKAKEFAVRTHRLVSSPSAGL